MSFPRYPKYKDSGVEWLGEVPEHWGVTRLRAIGPLLKGCGGSKQDVVDDGVPCVRYGDLYTTHAYTIHKARTFVTHERATDYFKIQRGDVLFAASGEDMAEIGRSAVVLLHEQAVCGGDLVVLRPAIEVVPEFLGYACDCPTAKSQKAALGRGTTVKHIYPDELKRLMLAVPPPAEQTAIAAFLDRETAKIDALIAVQQRLIELLQEKRQAVISHAVTKGLNPDVPMKDSGIEWLGEVPEHWATPPLYLRYDAVLGKMLDEKRYRGTHLLPYVRNIDVQWDRVNVQDLPEMDILPDERERFTLRSGDLLVCEGGEVGRTAIWRDELATCAFQKAIHRLRPQNETENTRYFFYCMQHGVTTGVFIADGNPNTIPHLTGEKLRRHRFPTPSLVEQTAIADFLDRETAKIDALIAEQQRAIALLQERRSALISVAVTGQIDVRGIAGTEAA